MLLGRRLQGLLQQLVQHRCRLLRQEVRVPPRQVRTQMVRSSLLVFQALPLQQALLLLRPEGVDRPHRSVQQALEVRPRVRVHLPWRRLPLPPPQTRLVRRQGGRLEGLMADRSGGRKADRREGRSGGRKVDRREGRSGDPTGGQRVDQTEGLWEGHSGGRSGRMMEGAIRVRVVLLLLVAQEPQCRRKHRQACCRVGTLLHRLALFLQKSFLSPRWHPFHPHGAA